MNQILMTNSKNKPINKKKIFSIQLVLSIIAILIFIGFYISYKIKLDKRENFSDSLIKNYNILKLYSSDNTLTSNNDTNNQIDNSSSNNLVIGLIEIPKINLFYPIFSQLNDELLKVSPCKFYGEMPDKNSNLCIAGHNYDNDKFFSRVPTLSYNDEIIIHDNYGNRYSYTVIKNYEVKENDLSPIYDKISDSYELTLITCNNVNNNRIIIKAKKKVH